MTRPIDSDLLCLGIESTAHTFGAGVVSSDGSILSDVRSSYIPPIGKGIHPTEAARHHASIADQIIKCSLDEADITARQISCIAVALGPGLGPPLRVGATIARALSLAMKIPLVPVHHGIGHIEIGCLTTGAKDPVVVLVSGGHTAIVALKKRRWRIFGETQDITVGNLIDAFARSANLPSPGGPHVEELAQKGTNYIELPFAVKGCDVSFSGLLTAASKKLLEGDHRIEDLCFSIQEASFSMLAEVAERALALTEKSEILLTGGVAANKALQKKMQLVAELHGARSHVVDGRYSGDSGVQIAWAGIRSFHAKLSRPAEECFVKPRWRLDEFDVSWRRE